MTEDERAKAIVGQWVEKAEVFEFPEPVVGIYLLYLEKRIVYIGQSIDLASRIRAHIRDRKKRFDAFGIIRVPREILDDVETAFIRFFKPEQNGTLHIARVNNTPLARGARCIFS